MSNPRAIPLPRSGDIAALARELIGLRAAVTELQRAIAVTQPGPLVLEHGAPTHLTSAPGDTDTIDIPIAGHVARQVLVVAEVTLRATALTSGTLTVDLVTAAHSKVRPWKVAPNAEVFATVAFLARVPAAPDVIEVTLASAGGNAVNVDAYLTAYALLFADNPASSFLTSDSVT